MKRGIAEVLGDDPQGVYAPEMSQLVEALLAKSNSFVEQRMLQTFIQSLPQVEKCAFLEKLVKSVVEEEREPVWNLTKQFQQTLGKVSLQKALSALSFLNELGSALSELWHKECLLLLFLLSAVKDAKKGGTKFLQEAKFSPLQLLLFFDVVVCQVAAPRQHKLVTMMIESLGPQHITILLALPFHTVSKTCKKQYNFIHEAIRRICFVLIRIYHSGLLQYPSSPITTFSSHPLVTWPASQFSSLPRLQSISPETLLLRRRVIYNVFQVEYQEGPLRRDYDAMYIYQYLISASVSPTRPFELLVSLPEEEILLFFISVISPNSILSQEDLMKKLCTEDVELDFLENVLKALQYHVHNQGHRILISKMKDTISSYSFGRRLHHALVDEGDMPSFLAELENSPHLKPKLLTFFLSSLQGGQSDLFAHISPSLLSDFTRLIDERYNTQELTSASASLLKKLSYFVITFDRTGNLPQLLKAARNTSSSFLSRYLTLIRNAFVSDKEKRTEAYRVKGLPQFLKDSSETEQVSWKTIGREEVTIESLEWRDYLAPLEGILSHMEGIQLLLDSSTPPSKLSIDQSQSALSASALATIWLFFLSYQENSLSVTDAASLFEWVISESHGKKRGERDSLSAIILAGRAIECISLRLDSMKVDDLALAPLLNALNVLYLLFNQTSTRLPDKKVADILAKGFSQKKLTKLEKQGQMPEIFLLFVDRGLSLLLYIYLQIYPTENDVTNTLCSISLHILSCIDTALDSFCEESNDQGKRVALWLCSKYLNLLSAFNSKFQDTNTCMKPLAKKVVEALLSFFSASFRRKLRINSKRFDFLSSVSPISFISAAMKDKNVGNAFTTLIDSAIGSTDELLELCLEMVFEVTQKITTDPCGDISKFIPLVDELLQSLYSVLKKYSENASIVSLVVRTLDLLTAYTHAILATDPFPLLLPFVTETGIEYGDRRRLNTLVLLHSIVCSALKHPESTAATETVLMQLAEEVIDEAITKYNLVSEMVNNILPQENTMIVDICLDLAAKAVERDNKKILAVFDPSANIVSNLVGQEKIHEMAVSGGAIMKLLALIFKALSAPESDIKSQFVQNRANHRAVIELCHGIFSFPDIGIQIPLLSRTTNVLYASTQHQPFTFFTKTKFKFASKIEELLEVSVIGAQEKTLIAKLKKLKEVISNLSIQ